jgi:hypothetical protein
MVDGNGTLTLNITETGGASPTGFHKMLQVWPENAVTWNSMGNGVQANGVEAETSPDMSIPQFTPAGQMQITVPAAAIQDWLNGQANHGWVLLFPGNNSATLSSREGSSPPHLSFSYTAP